MSLKLIAPLLVMSGIALADVPHTFQSGTPAKAREVNENFTNLDGRIAVFEEGCMSAGISADLVSYDPVDLVPGSQLTFLGEEYRIIQHYIASTSGTKYLLKYPIKASDDGTVQSYAGFTADLFYCDAFSLGGFAASAWDSDNWDTANWK